MKNKNKSKKGFTLLETLLAVFIFSLSLMMLLGSFSNFFKIYIETKKDQKNIENAQYAINFMAKILRTSEIVSPSGNFSGNFPLNIYNYSQGLCVTYKYESSKIQYGTVDPVIPGNPSSCVFTDITSFFDLTSNIISGASVYAQGSAADYSSVGKVTIALDVKDSTQTSIPVSIQTTVSLRGALKTGAISTSPCGGQTSITYNGYTYPIVEIGTQCWFAENLRTTKRPDGRDILDPLYTGSTYCNPNGCGLPWGRLYDDVTMLNGYTLDGWSYAYPSAANGFDPYTEISGASGVGAEIQGICPAGWHIPSDYNQDISDDMQKLSEYLGGDNVAGGEMKRTSTTYWNSPNTGATDSSGFSAVASGYWDGAFYSRGSYASFWTSYNGDGFMTRALENSSAEFLSDYVASGYPGSGYAASVRCVKNCVINCTTPETGGGM